MATKTSTPLSAQLKALQKATRWHFAWRGALGALLAALVLEVLFGLSGAGRYFYDHGGDVVMFHHSVERAERGHLGTGDVQVTLFWKGADDVDLHVIDPLGQRVYFGNNQVSGGGRLDLDMNAGEAPWSTNAQENIYWPFGSAPQGRYRVLVHHYRRNGGPNAIPFTLRILDKGRVSWLHGKALYVLPQGAVSGDAAGNVLDPLNALDVRSTGDVADFSVAQPPRTVLMLRPVQWLAILVCALWVAAIATTMSVALQRGLGDWYRTEHGRNPGVDRDYFVDENIGRAITRRSLAWNAGHGALAQVAFGLAASAVPIGQEAWRMAAWVVLAAWSGGRLGRLFPRHLSPTKGRTGGWRGGLLGGLAFWLLAVSMGDSIGSTTDVPARLLSALLIGGCVGWMIDVPLYLPPSLNVHESESNTVSEVPLIAPPPVPEPVAVAIEAAVPETKIDKRVPVMRPVPETKIFGWSRRGTTRRWQGRPGARGRRWKPGE